MRIIIFIFLLFCNLSIIVSQIKEFIIDIPKDKTYESNYNSITTLDLRFDTLDNGHILNKTKKAKIIFSTTLNQQLNNFLTAIIEPETINGNLLFVLRKFKLVERHDIDFEYGYCFMRATVFAKHESNFKRLIDIDTLITLRDLDVTDTLLQDARNNYTKLILRALKVDLKDKIEYSYNDILNI
jgi:hypothetical protein